MKFTIKELEWLLNTSKAMGQKGQTFEDPKTAYWLSRLLDKADKIVTESNEAGRKLALQLCLRDQGNQPILENGNLKFKDGIIPDEVKAVFEKEVELPVKGFPIPLERFTIRGNGWDVNYMRAFGKLIEEPINA